jgi:hypothetical protein
MTNNKSQIKFKQPISKKQIADNLQKISKSQVVTVQHGVKSNSRIPVLPLLD